MKKGRARPKPGKARPKAPQKARAKAPAKARAKSPAKAARKPARKPAPKARAKAKAYKLAPEQIQPIAEGYGACIASDKITVEGKPVRFMYREEPIHDVDSGWRFLSGLESDAYMQEPSNHGFYDCNTIANYDRTIIPLLDTPVGSVFEKPSGADEFAPVTDWGLPRD
jgi:hypothetical protein